MAARKQLKLFKLKHPIGTTQYFSTTAPKPVQTPSFNGKQEQNNIKWIPQIVPDQLQHNWLHLFCYIQDLYGHRIGSKIWTQRENVHPFVSKLQSH